MTVHKSQGSEFDSVYFILGTQMKYLTKELIYTAITRARNKLHIIGNKRLFVEALSNSTNRKSALGDMLYEGI
jgi:exodeoxyribonuclease V alpha subunit